MRNYQNIHEMIKNTVNQHEDKTAYKWFGSLSQIESVTWKEFYTQLKQVSKSLMALGIQKGNKITILSYTSYQWVLIDLASVSIGACTVGIYHSLLPHDCRYIINHSDSVIAFIQNEKQLEKVLQIRDEIPHIQKVILFNSDSSHEDQWILNFEEFLKLGNDISDSDFNNQTNKVTPQEPAWIAYTSGTTGTPKGVVLTHDNVTFTSQSARESIYIRQDENTFLFLPLAHTFARLCVYVTLLEGSTQTFARSMETVSEDIKASKPHWFASVPRVYEKIYSSVVNKAEAKGGIALKLFRWSLKIGQKISQKKFKGKRIPLGTSLKYKLASKLVFNKIHQALGGQVRWCISGAAPLNPFIAKFFHAADILILEGIGMTENTSFTNVNRYDNYRFGWVGPPGPGIKQKTSKDNEILYQGRNVMKEYYKMPEETAEVISDDEWLHTGDLGEIDDQGFLKVTGRKKEMIITSGGKNIAPALIEAHLLTSKYINQVCAIGDQRKFLTALITLDKENIMKFAGENSIPYKKYEDLLKNKKITDLIGSEIKKKNLDFASYESVKKFQIVPEFTIENGLLTPTLKPKRNKVFNKYENEIESMYASG